MKNEREIMLDINEKLSSVIDKKKYDYAFHRVEELERKYPQIFKNHADMFLHEIKKEDFIEKISLLIKSIKKYPLSNSKYIGSDKKYLSYGGFIYKKNVDFIEKLLKEDNIDMFLKGKEFKINYRDDFHKLYTFCKTENPKYVRKILRKRKEFKNFRINERLYIDYLFKFFPERLRLIEKEKKMYLAKRYFKEQKKRLFIFNVKISGTIFSIDGATQEKDSFNILISHINKEQAKKSLYYTYLNGELYDGLIKKFAKVEINQINRLEIEEIEVNKENIDKALEHQKEIGSIKYFHYGEIFEKLEY